MLCLRLHDSSDFQVNHTASAIIRQAVCTVFDRIQTPTPPANGLVFQTENSEKSRVQKLDGFGQDGFNLFHDLCLLAAGDPGTWLVGIGKVD